jgi:hypothetical protein
MIWFPKPELREDLYIVQKEEFSVTCCMCDTYTWQRRSLFIRDKPIRSSESMLHKNYDRKGAVTKKSMTLNLKGLGAKKNWLAVNRQS